MVLGGRAWRTRLRGRLSRERRLLALAGPGDGLGVRLGETLRGRFCGRLSERHGARIATEGWGGKKEIKVC